MHENKTTETYIDKLLYCLYLYEKKQVNLIMSSLYFSVITLKYSFVNTRLEYN